MANEVAGITAGIKAKIEGITGLRCYQYSELPVTEFPCVLVRPEAGPKRLTIGGNGFEARFRLTLYIQIANTKDAWTEVEKYLEQVGTYSVIAALEADQTLGSTRADYVFVDAAEQVENKTLDDQVNAYPGAKWSVVVGKSVA